MKKQQNSSKHLSEHEFDVLYFLKKNGKRDIENLSSNLDLPLDTIRTIVSKLNKSGFLDDFNGITPLGIKALLPYKVDNAIIMAAGTSSRFVPLSYDCPKALLKVKGEILIERQIKQLKEAGVNYIIVVLGYKKETLFYLEDKFDVQIIINPYFIEKNNIETLWLAKDYIRNTYICCSDQYFVENPFRDYVYDSYYDCDYASAKRKACFITKDKNGYITKVKENNKTGIFLAGEVYWNKQFSKEFLRLIKEHNEIGDYDSIFWERLYVDNLDKLPKLQANLSKPNNIHEFNSLDELREFDMNYVNGVDSQILNNICSHFNCFQSDIKSFKTINKGLTNTSFSFIVHDERYVYRHPGVGANEIVNRYHEKKCLEIAKTYAIDPSFICEDSEEGWKISKFIYGFHEPDYNSIDDSLKVIETLRRLHSLNVTVDWEFKPWEESLELENQVRKNTGINMPGFDELKNNICLIYSKIKDDGTKRCLCHCDTYSSNWMITETDTYLIDWEYGGMSDPGVDVGYYMADGEFSIAEARNFIKAYCGYSYDERTFVHYLSWAAIVSYYWFVWALFKESRGAIMGESLHRWYKMAKKYSSYLLNNTLISE